MKKRICPPLLLAAMLSMTACTEVLEPNVDYGSNTYINDYSALVKAVNDLQKSLEERFAALNSLLQSGMADIKLSIDENTGKISVLEATTKTGLANIDTSLLNGFTAIADSIVSTGDKVGTAIADSIASNGYKVVTAMNTNGDFIKVAINDQGKAISTKLANIGVESQDATEVLSTLLKAQIAQKKAVETLTGDDKTNAEKIIKKLDEMLNERGVYVATNETTGNQDIYVKMETWVTMTEDTKEVLGELAPEVEVEVEGYQYDGAKEPSTSKVEVTTSKAEGAVAVLQPSGLKAYPDVTGSEEILLYKLNNVPTEINLSLTCEAANDGVILNKGDRMNEENIVSDNRVKAYMVTDASGKHGKSVSALSTKISCTNFDDGTCYYTWTYKYDLKDIPATLVGEDDKVNLNADGKLPVKIELFTAKQADKYKDMTIDD